MPRTIRPALANRLLSSLPDSDYERLRPSLKLSNLTVGQVLYEPGQTIEHVYFPNDSIVSMLSSFSARVAFDVRMVGNEGMVGLQLFKGVNVSSSSAVVQGAGSAMLLPSAEFHLETTLMGGLQRRMHSYAKSWQDQVTQSSTCHRLHSAEARLACWLIMSSDRLGTDQFLMTREFMSDLLGVRRDGVSKAADSLQNARLINYSRGVIEIVNRKRLTMSTCECYGAIKAAAINTSTDSHSINSL